MAKRTNNSVAFEDFEKHANEFIGLTFDYCEEQLRLIPSHYSLPKNPKRQALAFAAMSVQQSIKAFLTILQIETTNNPNPGACGNVSAFLFTSSVESKASKPTP